MARRSGRLPLAISMMKASPAALNSTPPGSRSSAAAEDGCVLARLTKEVAEEERGTDNGEDAIEESGRHRSGSGGLCPSQGRLDSGRGAPTGSLFCRAVIAAGRACRAVLVR